MKKMILTLFVLITVGVTFTTFTMGYQFGCKVWDGFYEKQLEE